MAGLLDQLRNQLRDQCLDKQARATLEMAGGQDHKWGPAYTAQPRTLIRFVCMQQLPPLPAIAPRSTALFLDFDGTLADLAPQPEAVRVADDLVALLRLLFSQVDGALAIVSGRRLSDLDEFLHPLELPSAAEHGAQRRLADGQLVGIAPPDLQHAIKAASALAKQHAGLQVEIKNAAVALHYRHAPELETLCLQIMTEATRASTGVELLCGKYVFEIKPAGVSKGTAIATFMLHAPFAGRVPLFAGDDVTDEAGFAAVQSLGGAGIKVGDGETVAQHRCGSPAALRQWLREACPNGGLLPENPGLNTKKSFQGMTS
jgi:trehalose 6-phosphate phosphatase